jgi:hypothetical protein
MHARVMSNYLIFGATSRGANLHDFIQKQNPFPQFINPQVVKTAEQKIWLRTLQKPCSVRNYI